MNTIKCPEQTGSSRNGHNLNLGLNQRAMKGYLTDRLFAADCGSVLDKRPSCSQMKAKLTSQSTENQL